MEVIIKYKSIDGREFASETDCIKHELIIKEVDEIMSVLPHRPDSIDFTNGDGYIQHDKDKLKKVKINLLTFAKKHINHEWIQKTIDDENSHPSFVARLFEDYSVLPLQKAWDRFYCVDSEFREWGQPYFAINPTEGKQHKWN